MDKLTRRDAIKLAGTGTCVAAAFLATRSLLAADAAAKDAPATSSSATPAGTVGKPGTVAPAAGPNAQAAEAMFREGFGCAQAVLSCCGKTYGLSREMGCRMGAAFSGGMSMMGLTCGAVTGAFMVIGLKHAQLEVKDTKPLGEANRLGREFIRRFTELHGAVTCKELLGHDISTPDGLKATVAEELFTKKCPILVRDASALVEAMLAEEAKVPTK